MGRYDIIFTKCIRKNCDQIETRKKSFRNTLNNCYTLYKFR